MSINVPNKGETKFTMLNKTRGTVGITSIKTSNTTSSIQTAATFASTIASASAANPFWSAAQLQPAVNTLEQVIVDITGEGVLTNVITPYNDTSPIVTYTVRVEVDDGIPIEYLVTTSTTGQTLILGYVSNFNASTATANNIGLGSVSDHGFSTNEYITVHTPLQVVNESDYGLKFKTSLRVTVQSSVNMSATAAAKAYALYTTFIPKGL